MKNILVILESPNKINTVSGILAKVDTANKYTVMASCGHLTVLSKTGKYHLGLDFTNYEETYEIDPLKKEIAKKLKSAVAAADEVILATDNDREGESIAWHLTNQLNLKKKTTTRVVFTEITETGVKEGLKNKRSLDDNIVSAARMRRISDRMVGFQTSAVVRSISAHSAGRVQSATLKLVVDREREIKAFIPEKYYEIYLDLNKEKTVIKAQYKGTSAKKIVSLKDKSAVDKILDECKIGQSIVSDIKIKERSIESKEPFTTATFQMEALAKYSMTSKRAMDIAQHLFEGRDCGNGSHSLITYHRTDSTRISDEFVDTAKTFIIKTYGKEVYNGPKLYKKKDGEQSGHECIRITDTELTPAKAKPFLEPAELKIYTLVYNRTLASLMVASKIEDTDVYIENNKHLFVLTSHKILFPGYRTVYIEFSDQQEEYEKSFDFKVKEKINDKKFYFEAKETVPSQRYSEASLVKKMSTEGIGRPSTYAATIETLKKRLYVELDKRSMSPTELGIKATEAMEKYFPDIVDSKFTADMELDMDEVANGKKKYKDELKLFWDDFHKKVLEAKKQINKDKPPMELLEEICPLCGAKLVLRSGRFGPLKGCSKYPVCKFTTSCVEKKQQANAEMITTISCPKCLSGKLIKRKSKRGTTFYGCSEYSKTKCDFMMTEKEFKINHESQFSQTSTDKE